MVEANNDRWQQIMQSIQEQTSDFVNRFAQNGGQVQHPPPESPNRAFFDFYKLKPPSFTGGHDPLEAQYWLNKLNKIFKFVQCTEEQKVTFATYMFKGAADDWWEGARASMTAKGNPMDWEHFQEVFLNRYFPKFIREQKEQEFMRLQQGGMSVAEYVAEFEELASFLYHSQYAPDEERKINQFECGLRPDIRNNLAQLKFTNYTTLVHESYIAEERLKKVQEERQLKWQQRKDSAKRSQQLKVRSPQNKSKQVHTSNSPRTGKCSTCGKNHVGECLAGTNVCYWCKQPGHVIQNCVDLKQKEVEMMNVCCDECLLR